MPGTTDVALIGLEAAESEDQDVLDDVGFPAPREEFGANFDGQVKSYAELVEPPLEQLTLPAGQRSDLDRWVAKFLKDTDAELLIAGYRKKEQGPGYSGYCMCLRSCPSPSSADAPELSGWFGLTDYLVDRDLRGRGARNDLVADISAHLADLSNFLDGLDAWHNGEAAVPPQPWARCSNGHRQTDPTCYTASPAVPRARLSNTRQVTDASDRGTLLEFAQHDYEAVPVGSTSHRPSPTQPGRQRLPQDRYLWLRPSR